jgi:AcrR family transcriptional regulator
MAVVEKSVRRQEIIEAARARFRQFGIRKTSMQDIAADLGLSVGTLYLSFKSKDELIVGCAQRFAEKHKQSAEELLATDLPADEKLLTYVIDRYRAVEETRVGSNYVVEIAKAVIKLNPERFEEDDRWLFDNIHTILKEGIQSGLFSIEDPVRDTEVFVQAVTYFLPVAGMEPYRTPTEAKLIKMVSWFVDNWKTKR